MKVIKRKWSLVSDRHLLWGKGGGKETIPGAHSVWVSPNGGEDVEARGHPDTGDGSHSASLAVPLKTKRCTHSPYDPRITALGVCLK